MRYSFTEIFDIEILNKLCSGFTEYSGMGTAILDLEGNIHVGTGWQEICTRFHRKHPETEARCIESDTALANQLKSG